MLRLMIVILAGMSLFHCALRNSPDALKSVKIVIDPSAPSNQVEPKVAEVRSVGGSVTFVVRNVQPPGRVEVKFHEKDKGKDPFAFRESENHPAPGALVFQGPGEYSFTTDKRAGQGADEWIYEVVYEGKTLDPIIKTIDID